jgi:hypothetical protein
MQEELAERASWLLAEEEVLLMEQQVAAGDDPAAAAAAGEAEGAAAAAGAGEGPGLAEHPSSVLDGLTATDINKMKVRGGSRRGGGCRKRGAEGIAGVGGAVVVWGTRTRRVVVCWQWLTAG